MPGGTLEAPGAISDVTAGRLKSQWDENYTGVNRGKVAVLGDGLKYTPHRMTSVDSQQIERSKRLDEHVCACFHVPPFIVGLAPLPSGMKPGDLKQIYYDDCLHVLIEEFELCMDEGLALPPGMGVELDLDTLLRMDQATLIDTLVKGVKGGVMTPNYALRKQNQPPIEGGDTIYMQKQDIPLEQARNNVVDAPVQALPAPQESEDDDESSDDVQMSAEVLLLKFLHEDMHIMRAKEGA
jgi:HK97 family phage portal protein